MLLTYGLNSYISKLATAQNLSIEILIELYMASAKRQPDDIFDWIKWIAEAGFAGQATGVQKINPFKEHMGHGMVPEKIMADIQGGHLVDFQGVPAGGACAGHNHPPQRGECFIPVSDQSTSPSVAVRIGAQVLTSFFSMLNVLLSKQDRLWLIYC